MVQLHSLTLRKLSRPEYYQITLVLVVLPDRVLENHHGIPSCYAPVKMCISELADTIRERTDILTQIDSRTLWKPVPSWSSSPPYELSGRVKALHLNVTGNEHDAMLLDKAARSAEFSRHISTRAHGRIRRKESMWVLAVCNRFLSSNTLAQIGCRR